MVTEQDKQILFQDLCARLPYGVKVLVNNKIHTINAFYDDGSAWLDDKDDCSIEEIKPYLRPMSSMTDDEKEDLLKTIFKKASNKFYVDKKGIIDGKPTDLMTEGLNSVLFGPKTVTLYMDWLLKHYFDFNNLIKRKLALPAPPDMYKID